MFFLCVCGDLSGWDTHPEVFTEWHKPKKKQVGLVKQAFPFVGPGNFSVAIFVKLREGRWVLMYPRGSMYTWICWFYGLHVVWLWFASVSFPLTDQPHIYDARRFNVTGFASPGWNLVEGQDSRLKNRHVFTIPKKVSRIPGWIFWTLLGCPAGT